MQHYTRPRSPSASAEYTKPIQWTQSWSFGLSVLYVQLEAHVTLVSLRRDIYYTLMTFCSVHTRHV